MAKLKLKSKSRTSRTVRTGGTVRNGGTVRTGRTSRTGRTIAIIYGIVHFIVGVIAIYLSFKCNGGFRVGPTLASIFFPYFYLIYLFATDKECLMSFGTKTTVEN